MLRMHTVLGIDRCVLTQPSVYGTDNRAMMDAIATAPERYRAIVAVEADVTDRMLEDWHEAGARGVRFNFVDKGGMPFDNFEQVIEFSKRLIPFGWHIELLVHVNKFPKLRESISRLHTDVVFGHLGYMKTSNSIDNPGFRELLSLLRGGRCWAKLTGAYRISANSTPPYDDVVPVAQALIEAAPDQLVWGSDWPHPWHYADMPNDGYLLDQIKNWTDDANIIEKILVDNPARLYDF